MLIKLDYNLYQVGKTRSQTAKLADVGAGTRGHAPGSTSQCMRERASTEKRAWESIEAQVHWTVFTSQQEPQTGHVLMC